MPPPPPPQRSIIILVADACRFEKCTQISSATSLLCVQWCRFNRAYPLPFELHVHAPQVTRASDVKPLARVITYSCDTCGYETYQEVSWVCAFILQLWSVAAACVPPPSLLLQVINDTFMPTAKCDQCEANQITSKVTMQV